jgi:pSer/pThr/pTyr-binding forkhead associated (FHA) protein
LIAVTESLEVEDLGSTNGTFVNGQRLPPGERRRLRVEDVLRVGKVEFRVLAGQAIA